MAKSKFFRVAVEGATCDGRTIERSWIEDMASTFNRETYGPRINMEHIRGVTGQAPFSAYGDVVALEARDVELSIGGKNKKLRALYAQIEPTDELVKLTDKKQKIYTSIEVQPDFAKTGKAGLVGLAVTDNPASLGTEILSFAAKQGENNPFASRKADKGNFISEAIEVAIEMEDAPATPPAADTASGFFAAATAFFQSALKASPSTEPEKPAPAEQTPPPAPANDNAAFTALAQGMSKVVDGVKAMSADLAKLRTDQDQLRAAFERTDNNQDRRKPASGGGNFTATDC